jgi:hypothetical protein
MEYDAVMPLIEAYVHPKDILKIKQLITNMSKSLSLLFLPLRSIGNPRNALFSL